jgi:ubiquinol-cytochrome c reductase cytochrome b/c1 subunit
MTYRQERFTSSLRIAFSVAAVGLMLAFVGTIPQAQAAEGGAAAPKQDWTFAGPFGYYDTDQLRRGFKVYNNVCAACHGMRLLYYRNLSDPSGPNLPEEQVEAIAAEKTVTDGPNDQGDMFEREATSTPTGTKRKPRSSTTASCRQTCQ